MVVVVVNHLNVTTWEGLDQGKCESVVGVVGGGGGGGEPLERLHLGGAGPGDM